MSDDEVVASYGPPRSLLYERSHNQKNLWQKIFNMALVTFRYVKPFGNGETAKTTMFLITRQNLIFLFLFVKKS